MSAYPPPAPARPSIVPTVLGAIGVALLGVLLLLVLAYVVSGLGATAAGICAVVALVPLLIVLAGVRWVDRWEPEAPLGLWFAFLWGAAGSVAISLLVDLGVQIAVYASGAQPSESDFVGAVIQAPIVEESAKGLGVLLILLIWRRSFDGPVDGIVYAAVVASGFAFVENILYFGSALVEGGLGSLAVTFFLRGVLSPFAHVLFTSCTGAALGFAMSRPPAARLPIALLGLALAAFLHALWNGSSFLVADWFGFYGVVQVPLFVVAVVVVALLRRQERRVTLERLGDYAAAGWLSPTEVRMIGTAEGRRTAARWARVAGGDRPRAMRGFIRSATRLAHVRQQQLAGRGGRAAAVDERVLLDELVARRAALTGG
ncbi:PrsW family intramembrane metalloprotease [Rathayibacter sp. VKM Ac-2927]|uniref:PrsW family intramembrane metalloprotease n=1 Tax=Rathayibacter sp. VKM Ac-2927 TaxID=2929478 RepID=UPI001FB2B15B|nr:PrsW family intramembrane metalloprotease [Rathayibacter sp. VKM Ac-2927]MCJ1689108.1 PrsW family intramembrane metalloprotease [Rathayibacter sp. VKM Ac-2927]